MFSSESGFFFSVGLRMLFQPQLSKNHPYLFSQCQAIHARSLFPCQDSPGIKIKYTAKVQVISPLVALMSSNLQHDKTVKGSVLIVHFFNFINFFTLRFR